MDQLSSMTLKEPPTFSSMESLRNSLGSVDQSELPVTPIFIEPLLVTEVPRNKKQNTKGKRRVKTSMYRGVSYSKKNAKWKSVLTVRGRQMFLGYHKTEETAAEYYDLASMRLNKKRKKVNFPGKNLTSKVREQTPKSSMYKGVSWSKSNSKWKAVITHEGKQFYLGYFESEVAAAKAYDKDALRRKGQNAKINAYDGTIHDTVVTEIDISDGSIPIAIDSFFEDSFAALEILLIK